MEPDVYLKNRTSFAATGREFQNNQQCYYTVSAKNTTNIKYNYYIDVNVTMMRGVWGLLHNGTSAKRAGNVTEI